MQLLIIACMCVYVLYMHVRMYVLYRPIICMHGYELVPLCICTCVSFLLIGYLLSLCVTSQYMCLDRSS